MSHLSHRQCESMLINAFFLPREAKAELESQFRSMENRYKKGLLSANDKVKYAEMCAQRESARRNGLISKNEQCVVC